MITIQGTRLILLLLIATSLPLLITASMDDACAGSLPAAVEDVADRSDLIVLGRVTATAPAAVTLGTSWKMVYTRHAFEVEAYYKGTGPNTIPLFTPGGIQTRMINGESKRVMSQVSGAVGVEIGEEMLAFLRAAHGGYVFIEWDGAKYPVKADRETGERTVALRLRKKKNMQGTALQSFERLAAMQEGPNPEATLEARLIGKAGLRELVAVKDLQERISALIRSEDAPSQEGPGVLARDGP